MERNNPPKLLDQVRQKIRYFHYSKRTEQAYIYWIRRYILFHNKHHPVGDGWYGSLRVSQLPCQPGKRIRIHTEPGVHSVIFLYKHILDIDVGEIPEFQYARKPKRLPVVLTQDKVRAIFHYLREPHKTIVGLIYGFGLRLNECLNLRILDVDFWRREIMVRRGKGNKDRRTVLTDFVAPGLKLAIKRTELYFEMD